MINRVCNIFFSPTGTTRNITREVCNAFNLPVEEYDLTKPDKRNQIQNLSFNSNDIVIVGIPVYAGRIPVFFKKYLSKFKAENTPTVYIAVYGNRDYDDALLELKNTMQKLGFNGIAAGAFIGEHSFTNEVATNRPDSEDLAKARNFGVEINKNLKKLLNKDLEVKGNFPYREIVPSQAIIPETNASCNSCGLCAELCPMAAIDFNNFNDVNPDLCIKCHSCVKNCPQDAKEFNSEYIKQIQKKLIDNFSINRKEPELFL